MGPELTKLDIPKAQPRVEASAIHRCDAADGSGRRMIDAMLETANFIETSRHDAEHPKNLLNLICRILHADVVTVYQIDDERGALHLRLSVSASATAEPPEAEIDRHEGLMGKVLSARRAILDQSGGTSSEGFGSQMASPLMNAGELSGVILARADAEHAFQQSDLDLLKMFAVQVASCQRDRKLRSDLETVEASLRDQFLRAEKMRTMGEMASGVFHDFNNILGAVIGRMQLLQCKVQDESLRNMLTQVERIALQGAQTVNRLQEFARLQETKETGPTDLNRVVEDSLELTRHRWETVAQKRGIDYTIQKKLGKNVTVQGVHAQLVDVIVNLVRNAIDAMADGGELTFETTMRGAVCRLSVSDTGSGMSPEQIDQVFTPFYTTKGADGTGLGMTVVNDIVQSLNGTIHLDSKLGQGTTISIDLPVHGNAVVAPEETAAPQKDDGLRLLVVDDDDIILEVVTESLDDAGHHVDSFKQGADAIEAIGRNAYDVIITDLGMPGVTGWDVARSAKMHEPKLPVVVISGWGAQFTDDQLTDSGVDAMLAKPFHLKMLRETIERLARGESAPTKIITK